MLLVRENVCYRPRFKLDRSGLLLITKKRVIALGWYAGAWA